MVFGTPPKIQFEPALPEEGSELDSLVEQVPAEDVVELLGKKEVWPCWISLMRLSVEKS